MRLTHNFDAWIVGSAAKPDAILSQVRDFDILVPFDRWHDAALVVPGRATPNSFGGWKFDTEGVEIDFWPGDLSWMMQRPSCNYAWHPKSGRRIAVISKLSR